MSRKTAREVAMKLAFAKLIGGEDTYEAVLEKSGIEEIPTSEDHSYAAALVEGVEEKQAEIDARIESAAIGWKLERMPKVDLCILRIAIFEMFYREDVPSGVAINEAVELAKQFGGDKSSAYINGILGTLAKELA